MNIRKGQFFYTLHRNSFRIMRCDSDGCMSGTPARGESVYSTREEARKRVFELNGWNCNR